jgi:methionyl-tRNA synthetase
MTKFYITTPIYYINDVPHIGHSCTTIAADIVARWHRQKGDEVFYLTGTDEHGQKVAEAAAAERLEPKSYCDKIAPRFEEAWKKLNISYDFFIRTTDPRHETVVQEVLQKIFDKGDVYKGKYEGYYCVGCEKFLTESELVDRQCPIHPPEKTVFKAEDNWFFKLSKYSKQITRLLKNDETNYIFPQGKRAEVLAKLKSGVRDISISRETVEWGIPTPWDKTQTIYVWFDALINYYSACQLADKREGFWPADVHLLAKEISWFHAVIWQAMLLSAGLPLPKETYIHSFYIIDGQKMSKSLGNVISPEQLVERFGVDGTRYLIARSFPNENDADVGISRFTERYNADLANNLGNLVSRVIKLAPSLAVHEETAVFDPEYEKLISSFHFDEAIGLVFNKWVDATNNRLNQEAPWKLAADDPKRIKVLSEAIKNLKITAWHLKPVMPETADNILDCFDETVKPLEKPLFPRIT